ncbi:MAG: Holliday junction resolvase RuvX [Bacteroidota bacterium]
MGRILAIDYGTKRCGLAVTDPTRTIATALETVPTHRLFDFLNAYFSKEPVDAIVIGEPKRLTHTASESTRNSLLFADRVRKSFPDMPVQMYDERFTSKMAQQSLLQSGQSRQTRKDKAVLDRVSATILLQDYMQSLSLKP